MPNSAPPPPQKKKLRHFQKSYLLVSAVSRGHSDLEAPHFFLPPLRAHIRSEHLFRPQRCLLTESSFAFRKL